MGQGAAAHPAGAGGAPAPGGGAGTGRAAPAGRVSHGRRAGRGGMGAGGLAACHPDRERLAAGAGNGGARLRPHDFRPTAQRVRHRRRGRAHRDLRRGRCGGWAAVVLPSGHVAGPAGAAGHRRGGRAVAAPAGTGAGAALYLIALPAGGGEDHAPAGPHPLFIHRGVDHSETGRCGRRAGGAGGRVPAGLFGAAGGRAGLLPQGGGAHAAAAGDVPPGAGGG